MDMKTLFVYYLGFQEVLQVAIAYVHQSEDFRDFLGHEDISTTMIYRRADNRLKKEAINELAPKVTEEVSFQDWTKDQDLLSFLNSFK